MLIAEKLLLISRTQHGESRFLGKGREIARFLAVAVIAELNVLGRLRFVAGQVVAPDDFPTSHSVLNDALAVLHRKRELSVAQAIQVVRDSHSNLETELLDSMVRRGLLLRISKRRFGIIPASVYAVQSTQSVGAVVAELRQFGASHAVHDYAAASLFALADLFGVAPHVLTPDELGLGLATLQAMEGAASGTSAPTTVEAERARLLLALTNPLS